MQITIAHYIAPGESGERFQLHIHASFNLSDFSIVDNQGHRFTFTDRSVRRGDKIIIHIGRGSDFIIEPEDDDDHQETIYIFYWDIDSTHWDPETSTISIVGNAETETYTLDEILYVKPQHDR